MLRKKRKPDAAAKRRRGSGALQKHRLLHKESIALESGRFLPICGYLEKKSTKGKWQRRWFEAHDHYLTYRATKEVKKTQAVIDLRTCGDILLVEGDGRHAVDNNGSDKTSSTDDGANLTPGAFNVHLKARVYELRVPKPWTEDVQMADEWVRALLERKGAYKPKEESHSSSPKKRSKDTEVHEFDASVDIDMDVHHATRKIQSVVRARKARKHTHEKRKKHSASKKIQSIVRGKQHRKKAQEIKRVDTATRKIQAAVRGKNARQKTQTMKRLDTKQIRLVTARRMSHMSTAERNSINFEEEQAKIRAQLDAFYQDVQKYEKKPSLSPHDGDSKSSSPRAVVALELYSNNDDNSSSVGLSIDASDTGVSNCCSALCFCLIPKKKAAERI